MEESSPRVNSALLGGYAGKKVRLVCKVLNVNTVGRRATVEASDGGRIEVQFHGEDPGLEGSTFVEVVGTAADATTIKAMLVIKLSDNLDMSIVERAVKMMHEERFADLFQP
ncbi:hypothetical protein AAF712_007506 [Marasmius tenuissimus]|uniref:Replication factor A protein 3 n=1 Tax=Marasmius tenuissimus TaxID=585030 RepID=A0ABR2ZYQ9_9AGAR